MIFSPKSTVMRYVSAAFLCTALLLLVGILTHRPIQERAVAEARLDARERAQMIRFELERDLSILTRTAISLSAAISHNTNIDQRGFEQIASRVLAADGLSRSETSILSVATSEDLSIKFTHSYGASQTALGTDYGNLHRLLGAIEPGPRSEGLTISAPIELSQGNMGIVARVPVLDFESGKLWGIVSVLSSLPVILAETDDALSASGLDYALYKNGAHWPVAGNPSVFAKSPISFPVQLPGGEIWTLSVVPKAGWVSVASEDTERAWMIYGLIGSLAFAVFALFDWAATARRKATAQLRLAIDGIPDGFALYDKFDRLVICNEAYRRYYPRSAKKIVPGMTFREIIAYGLERGEYLDAIGNEKDWLEQRMIAHAKAETSMVQRLADGRWLKVFERRLEDGSTVGFRVDITELIQARQEAENGSRAKSLFLDRMSHELRTPIAILLGYISFIESPSRLRSYKSIAEAVAPENLSIFEAELSNSAARISNSGRQLLGMIDRILDVSEIDRRTANEEPSVLPLKDTLSAAIGGIEWLPGKRPKVNMPDEAAVTVLAERASLERALTAVLRHCDNAFENSDIEVFVKQHTATIEICFDTRGKRAPSVLEAKIFNKAFEAGDAKRGTELSLDLAIAERLIVQSKGACFYYKIDEKHDRIEMSIPRRHLSLVSSSAA